MKNNLQKLRKQSKLSQTDLAKMLGVTRQAISLYEQGKRQLKEKDINTLIKYFNVSKKYLLGAYSKEEIAKIVQERMIDDIKEKKGIYVLVFMPANRRTVEDYLIAIGVIPYDIPKEKDLLTNEQINNLDFWIENLKLIYNDVAMQWLITKPSLDASKEDVLSAVNSAMNTVINASVTGYREYDIFDDFTGVYDMEQVVKNHYMQKRLEFLKKNEYWDDVEVDEGHWEKYPVYDFKHPHELDGERHYIDEIK